MWWLGRSPDEDQEAHTFTGDRVKRLGGPVMRALPSCRVRPLGKKSCGCTTVCVPLSTTVRPFREVALIKLHETYVVASELIVRTIHAHFTPAKVLSLRLSTRTSLLIALTRSRDSSEAEQKGLYLLVGFRPRFPSVQAPFTLLEPGRGERRGPKSFLPGFPVL